MIVEDRIEINPEICQGKPCIKGTRIMVSIILEWLEAGKTFNEIIEAYPTLKKEDVSAAIRFARKLAEDPFPRDLSSQEREENLGVYTKLKDELFKNNQGKYAVISKGKLQAIGDSFDAVKDVAIDTNHRFIFKIEEKQKIKGTIRWPITRKK